jgi:hypothetical protein
MNDKHWRVYLRKPRIEFGIDYPTLAAARAARDRYQSSFPRASYYIRCIHKPGFTDYGPLTRNQMSYLTREQQKDLGA